VGIGDVYLPLTLNLLEAGCLGVRQRAFLGQDLSGGVQGFDIDTMCPGVIYCRFSGGLARAKVLEPVLLTLGQ